MGYKQLDCLGFFQHSVLHLGCINCLLWQLTVFCPSLTHEIIYLGCKEMKRLARFPAVTHRLFQGSLETKLHWTLWSKSLQISIRLFLGAMECLAWWHRCFSLLKHTYMKETKYVSDFV